MNSGNKRINNEKVIIQDFKGQLYFVLFKEKVPFGEFDPIYDS